MLIGRTARFLAGALLVCSSVYAQGLTQTQTERQFEFSSTSAFFFQRGPNFISQASVRVFTGKVQSFFEGTGTFVLVNLAGLNVFMFGCWQIPDADFTASLESATLRTTIVPSGPNANPVCPFAFVLGTTPVQLNLTWTPNGTTTTSSGSTSVSCGAFSLESQRTQVSVRASATGTITGFVGTVTSGGFFNPGTLSETQIEEQVQNSPDPSCLEPFL